MVISDNSWNMFTYYAWSLVEWCLKYVLMLMYYRKDKLINELRQESNELKDGINTRDETIKTNEIKMVR